MKRFLLFLFAMSFILIVVACGGRDLSNVKTSLYGQWKNESNDISYYFSKDGTLTVVDEGNESESLNYRVLEHDEIMNYIHFIAEGEGEGGYTYEVTFSNDERIKAQAFIDYETGGDPNNPFDALFSDIIDTVTEVEEESWTYLSRKQKP